MLIWNEMLYIKAQTAKVKWIKGQIVDKWGVNYQKKIQFLNTL